VFCLGALIYGVAGSATILLISRLVQGFGDANLTVCRAYVGHVALHKEKVKYMSYTSAAQGLGFLVGSALAGIFAIFDTTVFGLPLNSNTAPGFFSFFVGIGNIWGVLKYMTYYKEDKTPITDSQPGSAQAAQIHAPPNLKAVIVSNVIFYLAISSFSTILATATVYLNFNFGWETGAISLVYMGGSLLGVCAFRVVPILNQRFNERYLMNIGLIGGGLSFCLMGGFGVAQTSLGVWITGAVFFFWFQPFVMATNLSLYAKIVGPFKGNQGPYMGYITMMGAAASICAPLYSVALLGGEEYAGTLTFFLSGLLLFVGTPIILFYWNIMVPHPAVKAMKQAKSAALTEPLNSGGLKSDSPAFQATV